MISNLVIDGYTRQYLFGLVTVVDSSETLKECANILVKNEFKEYPVSREIEETFFEYRIAEEIIKSRYCNNEILEILASSKDPVVRHCVTQTSLTRDLINQFVYDESFYVVEGIISSKVNGLTEYNLNELIVRITNINIEEVKKDPDLRNDVREVIDALL